MSRASSSGKVSPWFLVVLAALLTGVVSMGLVSLFEDGSGLAATSHETTPDFKRIVSLTPAMTETLVALGAADRLAGISDYCSLTPELEGKARVGTGLTPNLEAIVKLEPDLILVESSRQTNYQNLEVLGKVEPLAWLTLDEVVAGIRAMGKMTDTADVAADLSARISTRLGGSEPTGGPRVLLLIGLSSLDGANLWYIKPQSLHGAALWAAGGRNAVGGDRTGAPSISLEELLALDPDMIITMVSREELSEADRATYLDRLSRLTTLRAVQNQKLGLIVGKHCMSTGPAILDLVDDLKAEISRLSGDS